MLCDSLLLRRAVNSYLLENEKLEDNMLNRFSCKDI